MWLAKADFWSWSFVAAGETRAGAVSALQRGLQRHAVQYGIANPTAWSRERVKAALCCVVEVEPGTCLRNNETV